MKTKAIYLDDSYQTEMDATVLEVLPENGGRFRLILDQTVFYPMGGGQPTDQGKLTSPSWSADVYQVMMKDGEIWHYVQTTIAPTVGLIIHGSINWDRRFKNMKMHSAGHIIDFALFLLGYSPKQLTPLKGDHGKKPFITYQGILGKDIKLELQEKTNELVSKNLAFSWLFQPIEALQKEAIYLQPGLPTNKPLRTLRLEGISAVADGGTQIKKTSEVGSILIATIEEKEGNTIISYQIS